MRLLDEVKRLRKCFPELRIHQRIDDLNRKYAEIVLSGCTENPVIYFEYSCMILEFCGSRSMYGYRENDFRYMVSEIENLLRGKLFSAAFESDGIRLGALMMSDNEISEENFRFTAKRFTASEEKAKLLTVKLFYSNSELNKSYHF